MADKEKSTDLTDGEMVQGIQAHDPRAEKAFYLKMHSYFERHFPEQRNDPDGRHDTFMNAFMKLWTEIENHRIRFADGKLERRQTTGLYEKMSASLTTFMIKFASTEFIDSRRDRLDYFDDVFESSIPKDFMDLSGADDVQEIRCQIVDECISQMSDGCRDILTLFYSNGQSLDEIMATRSDRFSSKDGLKTAKNKCLNTLRQRVNTRCSMLNL